jgi:ribosomal protein L7/L12
LSREEQQARLRELARRGETMSAIYLARKLHGGSLAEAKDIVEQLSNKTAGP